jgi:hypothetical protein
MLYAKPTTVILDFVEPLGAGRHGFADGENANSNLGMGGI